MVNRDKIKVERKVPVKLNFKPLSEAIVELLRLQEKYGDLQITTPLNFGSMCECDRGLYIKPSEDETDTEQRTRIRKEEDNEAYNIRYEAETQERRIAAYLKFKAMFENEDGSARPIVEEYLKKNPGDNKDAG